ncbi:copper resistance protein CopC [Micromonospora sp. NPDC051296]|uniref:copper resistance CopC family protein n=1 Tax=Micromonospora sp. NPDC051296 TaxID=3155046 RepID=UPI00341A7A93
MSTTGRIYAGAALCMAALVAVLVLVGRIDADPGAGTTVEVLAMEPADGAVLPDLPTTVRIRVAGQPDPTRSHITVYDAERTRLDTGSIASDGDDGLRQQVTISRPGQLAVAYHVVTVDGRAASGIARLTVGSPGAADPAGAPARAAEPEAHAHGVDPIGAALLALDGLVLLVVLVLLLRRPNRGT